jgi:PKD domain
LVSTCLLQLAAHSRQVSATPGSTYTCKAFTCYNSATQNYRYHVSGCSILIDPLGEPYAAVTACVGDCDPEFPNPQNTNYSPNEDPLCMPGGQPINYGCEQGMYAETIPTCSGGGGEGGGDCPEGCLPTDYACTNNGQGVSCPGAYTGRDCKDIPCGYRDVCFCDTCYNNCSPSCNIGACGGGGGTTPTPTPTPAPSCDLACPGDPIKDLSGQTLHFSNQQIAALVGGNVQGATTLLAQAAGGNGGGAAGGFHACGDISGVQGTDMDNVTYGFGSVEGNLTYNGYNSFECAGLYACPLDPNNPEACPEPTITQGGGTGGSGILGAYTTRVIERKKSTSTIGKVLGAISDKLLAQDVGGGAGGAGAGGGASGGGLFSSTWTQAETINRLDGSEPTLYGYTVQNATGQSCSCQVVLGCRESQELSPNEEAMASGDCDESCNFTYDAGSEFFEANETVNITVEANDGFDADVEINYDDGTTEVLNAPYPSAQTHTFTNAGVYDVTLTCQNPGNNTKTCTRRTNAYCERTDPENLPTPTPTPPGAWMRYSDTSIYTRAGFGNPAPTGAVPFDNTDTLSCDRNDPTDLACVISGEAGVVTVKGTAQTGSRLSDRQWLREDSGYTMNTTLEPSSFIEYARARKEVNDVQAIDTSELQVNTINVYEGNFTLNDNDLPDFLQANQKMLIVIDGSLTIDMPNNEARTFNPDNKPFAFIVTGEIEIASATEELNGVFITNTVDWAYDAFPTTTTPLKINGAFSSMSGTTRCNSKRQREDNELQASCYDKKDLPNQIIPLWDLISTHTYEWSELVP